jgi:hypothetical protein
VGPDGTPAARDLAAAAREVLVIRLTVSDGLPGHGGGDKASPEARHG